MPSDTINSANLQIAQTLNDVCARHNLVPPTDPYPGGDYRLDDIDKIGQADGYLYLFADGLGGFVQNHRNNDRGESFFFGSPGQKLDERQKKELRRMRQSAKKQREADAIQAAQMAIAVWNGATATDPAHPYLVRKGVPSLAPLTRIVWQVPMGAPKCLQVLQAPVIMCPITDVDGVPMTVEYIDAVGEKRYHTGGSREAGMMVIARGDWSAGPVYLAEGVSTAATVSEATGRPCICAFDAGNMPKVAAAARSLYPATDFVICGDDDVRLERAGKPNKGRMKAEEAGVSGKARVVFPDFSALQERGDWSDFNDMAALLGAEAVKARIEVAAAKGRPASPIDEIYACRDQGTFYHSPSGRFWKTETVDKTVGKIGNEMASTWLMKHRAVDLVTWCPGRPLIIEDQYLLEGGWIDAPDKRMLNTYRPPLPSLSNNAGHSMWLDLLKYAYPDDAEHMINWFAHRVQHPGDKINHALVIGGPQGIGKDTILGPVRDAVGEWNVADVSPRTIANSEFNPYVQSVILLVSEARDLGEFGRFAFFEQMKTIEAAPPPVLPMRNLWPAPHRDTSF